MNLKKYISILNLREWYTKDLFKSDLLAGITVGIMLIPQGMAYALLAGLPPIYGLYTAIIPLIVYGFIGSSRQLSVGPVAMMALMVAAGAGKLAEPGTADYTAIVIKLTFMVGIIQAVMGGIRLGYHLVNFLAHPVINGFTSAAAVIIGVSQLKHVLGISIPRSPFVHEIFYNTFLQIGAINLPTLFIAIGGILIILGVKKVTKKFPAPIFAVIFGIIAVKYGVLDDYGVKITGHIPRGFPPFAFPVFDWEAVKTLAPTAFSIAFIGYMLSISIAKAFRSKHRDYNLYPNIELLAIGLGNILGSMFSTFPAAGGFSRTAVNDQAGSKSGLASVVSAVLIIFTLLFLTSLFYYLPKAILGSIILLAVYKLVDIKEAIKLWKVDKTDFLVLLITFLTTLFIGIEQGLLAGISSSLLLMIYRTTKPHVAELGRVPNTSHYRNVNRFDSVETREDILIIRFDAPLYFGNTTFFTETLEELIRQSDDQLNSLFSAWRGSTTWILLPCTFSKNLLRNTVNWT